MLSQSVLLEIQNTIIKAVACRGEFRILSGVSGGSINQCYRLGFGREQFFLKVNSAKSLPGMFVKEVRGLELLRNTSSVSAPRVIGFGENGDSAFLILEWIDAGKNDAELQTRLGKQLASLHKITAAYFGLDHDNYIGSLPQRNRQHSSWKEFFISERIEPQLRIAADKHLIKEPLLHDFTRLFGRLDQFYQEEPSSLIHGDLWRGNYLTANDGTPHLIDPAVYYGNREMDIAMTKLFGGFADSFYQAYNEAFPLQSGWQERLDLWNLYPLLVHVNLFGSTYLPQLEQVLKRYV
jgi:fructosamine-3-kinase